MDPNSSYNLEMRIVGPNCRAKWFSVNEVVDADRTLLTCLMEDLVDKYPPSYGDVATLFYWCMHSKVHIPVRNDQEMLAMFEKNRATRTCLLTVAYHSPGTQPVLPDWESGSPRKSVEPPFTPSVVSPSITEPSQLSMSQPPKARQPSKSQSPKPRQTSKSKPPKPSQPEFLANPNPMNEHMGIDDEGLYIDLGPNHPPPPPTSSQSQGGSKEREEEIDESSDEEVADRDDETSDEEDEEVEIDESSDEEVADREPEQFQFPDVEYDKDDPPMTVGTIYPDMTSFKIALASHAVKHEFNYEIDKSDTGRYTVHCSLRNEGCPWRLHASTSADGHGIQVMC